MKEHPSERLIRLRKKLGISQREMAQEFAVSNGAVALWESGERPIPGPVIKLIDSFESYLKPKKFSNAEINTIDAVSGKWAEDILLATCNKKAQSRLVSLRPKFKELIQYYLCKNLPHDSIQRRVQFAILQQLIQKIKETRGLPLKLIQLASHLDPEIPASLREYLHHVQTALTAMPAHVASRVIHQQFGQRPTELFAQWQAEPFATASIGQVHLARLHTGEWVAVKVQYPNIREELEAAFYDPVVRELLATLLWSGSSEVLEEFQHRVLQECDYNKEAENQNNFRHFFEGDNEIQIPRVFEKYCSNRVLTTGYFAGESFDKFLQTATQDEKNHAAELIVRFQAVSFFKYGYIYADIHKGNLLFSKGQLGIVDFGRVVQYHEPDKTNAGNLTKAILNNDIQAARRAVEGLGMVREWSGFDFDELWDLLREEHRHFHEDKPFKFTIEYLKRKNRLSKSFSQKSFLDIKAPLFWNWFAVSTHDAVRAELGAESNWRKLMLGLISNC